MTEKKILTKNAAINESSKVLNDEKLNSVNGGTTEENALVKVSFVGNDLTVSSTVLMYNVHLKINNAGQYSHVKNFTSYTFTNVRKEASVHYQVAVRFLDDSRKTIEFDNPSDPFEVEF